MNRWVLKRVLLALGSLKPVPRPGHEIATVPHFLTCYSTLRCRKTGRPTVYNHAARQKLRPPVWQARASHSPVESRLSKESCQSVLSVCRRDPACSPAGLSSTLLEVFTACCWWCCHGAAYTAQSAILASISGQTAGKVEL